VPDIKSCISSQYIRCRTIYFPLKVSHTVYSGRTAGIPPTVLQLASHDTCAREDWEIAGSGHLPRNAEADGRTDGLMRPIIQQGSSLSNSCTVMASQARAQFQPRGLPSAKQWQRDSLSRSLRSPDRCPQSPPFPASVRRWRPPDD
jgi:hypothetical protein